MTQAMQLSLRNERILRRQVGVTMSKKQIGTEIAKRDAETKIGVFFPVSLKRRLDAVVPNGMISKVFRVMLEDLVRALEKDESEDRQLLGMILKRSIVFEDMVKAESDPAFRRLKKLAEEAADTIEGTLSSSTELTEEIRKALKELQ